MNRRYNKEEFKDIVNIIRSNYIYPNLTTDIIVGFPGETEEEFNKTYEFLKQIKFYKMHVFKYSPRTGTKAASMKNQIDGNIKEKRSNILLELSDEFEEDYNKKYLNQKVEVLFETKKDDVWIGHTKNYTVCHFKSNDNLENKVLNLECFEIFREYINVK